MFEKGKKFKKIIQFGFRLYYYEKSSMDTRINTYYTININNTVSRDTITINIMVKLTITLPYPYIVSVIAAKV